MKNEEIVRALRRLKVETGSLVCMGCGREHDCGILGCRIVREAAELIARFPAADVAPVVHGRWVYHNFDTICSECRKSAIFDEWEQQAETEFCPNCGARMEAAEE